MRPEKPPQRRPRRRPGFSAIQLGATWLSASVVRITPSFSTPSSSQVSARSIAARRAAPAVRGLRRQRGFDDTDVERPELSKTSTEARALIRAIVGEQDHTDERWAESAALIGQAGERGARKQAGRRSSSILDGYGDDEPRSDGARPSLKTAKGKAATPAPTGSSNIVIPNG